MFGFVIPVTLGYVLDLLFGDPSWFYHPVRLIGWLIVKLEGLFRGIFPKTEKGERLAGTVCALFVIGLTTVTVWFLLFLAGLLHPVCKLLVSTFFCYTLFAVKSLKDESMKVYEALTNKTLSEARTAVSMIVGRDTANLTEEGVIKAAVETIAENTSDGSIAPLFYMLLGGPVLGYLYKAINTLDSMIGYKNDRYLHFGRFAAKLDDVVNFIPARLSAIGMIVAAAFLGYNGKMAWLIFKRDRYQHASPNSAQTEAVMAGALGIQLAGNAYYFGKLYEKPYIGDATRPVEVSDIQRANRLLYGTVFFLWLAGCLLAMDICLFFGLFF